MGSLQQLNQTTLPLPLRLGAVLFSAEPLECEFNRKGPKSAFSTFHTAIRFDSLVGNDDLLVLYHSASFAKQDRAANVMLFEHPAITLPLLLA